MTTSQAVLELFPPDERVRYLERPKLWAFLTEEHFWAPNSQTTGERAVSRMIYLLETAMGESLLTLQDFMDGVTFETISARLPQKELQRVVKHALESGRKKTPVTEESFLEVVPFKDLVGYLPLDHLYKRVLVAKVAEPAGFVTGGVGEEAWPEDDNGGDKSEGAEAKEAKAEAKRPPKPAKPEPKDSEETVTDEELEEVPAGSVRPPAEEEARRKVAERLSAINRLPPRHAELSTPILLSIESMYAELLTASSDDQREMCIRDSFPNEAHLSTALLALIELLDPSIDVNDPVIRDADADSLIKVVLFEERRRYEQANPSGRSGGGAVAPPPPTAAKRSVPPPLPGGRSASDEKRAR